MVVLALHTALFCISIGTPTFWLKTMVITKFRLRMKLLTCVSFTEINTLQRIMFNKFFFSYLTEFSLLLLFMRPIMPFMLGNITFYDYILNIMKESKYVSSVLEQCWYLV